MPREWYDYHAANKIEDDNSREMAKRIIANKKPYFMRHIYPSLMKEYRDFMKKSNRSSLREFGLTIEELINLPEHELTERQKVFLYHFNFSKPVGDSDCVMNKICRIIEDTFDNYISKLQLENFDHSFMKSGAEYSYAQFLQIKKLMKDYNKIISRYMSAMKSSDHDEFEVAAHMQIINNDFKMRCYSICSDKEALCDMILDATYEKANTKKFAWVMCGDQIIENLLNKNERKITYPTSSEDSSSSAEEYAGDFFEMKSTIIEEVSDDYS